MDGERALARVPADEGEGQGDREDRRRDLQGNAEVVGEIVADQCADHADQHDGEPVQARHVGAGPELEEQCDHEQGAHDQGRVGQPEAEIGVEEIGRGFPHRGAEDFDDPEVEGDLGDLVHQLAAP